MSEAVLPGVTQSMWLVPMLWPKCNQGRKMNFNPKLINDSFINASHRDYVNADAKFESDHQQIKPHHSCEISTYKVFKTYHFWC